MLATRKNNWGEDRVMFFDDQGRLRSLLTQWTSVHESDAFAHCAAARSRLRVDDLVALRALVDALQRDGERSDGVK